MYEKQGIFLKNGLNKCIKVDDTILCFKLKFK